MIDFSIWGKNQQYCSTLLNDLFCHFEFDLVSMFLLVILKSIDQIVDSATCVKRWAINLKWILFRTILQNFLPLNLNIWFTQKTIIFYITLFSEYKLLKLLNKYFLHLKKGTGKWTAISALEYGVPVSLIGKSIFKRPLLFQIVFTVK